LNKTPAYILALLLPGTLYAGEPAAQMQTGNTFLEILSYGIEINLILGLLAFIALFLVFHVLLSSRPKHTVPELLLGQILDDIASGDIEAAQNRTVTNKSVLARTVYPGLKLHDHPIERIHQSMEGAGRRAIGSLRQEVNYLANIGVLSPMLGLLGTVLGLMKAFKVMASELQEGSKSIMMGGAVGEAMGTTAAGLIVGIPAMLLYYLCMSRVARIGDEVEIAAEEIAAALAESK
jgi:biopolymer transport protein ExbB